MSSHRVFAFFWVFVLFLLQNSLNYIFSNHAPAILLIVVLFYSFSEGSNFGALIGLVAGFLMDTFGLGRPFFFTLAFSMMGYASGFASSKIFQDSLIAEVVFPFLSLYVLLVAEAFFIRSTEGLGLAGPRLLMEAFLPWRLLSTVLVSPFIFGQLQRVSSRSARARRLRN